jgi:hypothetical protein
MDPETDAQLALIDSQTPLDSAIGSEMTPGGFALKDLIQLANVIAGTRQRPGAMTIPGSVREQ